MKIVLVALRCGLCGKFRRLDAAGLCARCAPVAERGL